MNITKALADATRVRLIMALRQRELCACQITELFGLAPSTMSKHLSILYQAGLVTSRKEGRWIHYALPDKEAPAIVQEALNWVKKSVAQNSRIAEDAQQVKAILKMDPSDLCKRQCQK
jgi:DNA-binding transcriptional ArsR family regulator